MHTFNLIQLAIIGQAYGSYQVQAPSTNAYLVATPTTQQPASAYPVITATPTGYPTVPQPHSAYPVQQPPAPINYPVNQSPAQVNYPLQPVHNQPNGNRKCHKVTRVFDVCEGDQTPQFNHPAHDGHYRDIRFNQGLPTVYVTLPCGVPVPTHTAVHHSPIPPPPPPSTTPCTTNIPVSHPAREHRPHTHTAVAVIPTYAVIPTTTPCTTNIPASHPAREHRPHTHTAVAVIPTYAVIPATTPCSTFTVKVTSVVYHTAQATPCTTTPSPIPTYQVQTTTPCTTTPRVIPTYQVQTTTPCTTTQSVVPTYQVKPTTPAYVVNYSTAPTTTPCTTTTSNAPYLVNYNTQSIQYAQAAYPTKGY